MLLEDRVLLSAAPVDAALLEGGLTSQGNEATHDFAETAHSPVDAPEAAFFEIAFVDASAGDPEHFVRDLEKQAEAGRNLQIVLLDPSRDGLEQITALLAGRQSAGLPQLDAIHIIAHGHERAVRLGSGWLSVESFHTRLDEFATWDAALADGGDLLFYSCRLASTTAGQSMLQSIALAIGGDVAASLDDTGAASLGGNWELEFATGTIEAAGAVSTQGQEDFHGLLAVFTVTNTNNSGAGSLRQAILDANAAAGADIIDFNIPLTDVGHVYYRNDGIAGSLSSIATTTLSDADISDFDPDYPSAPYSWYRISLSSALPSLSDTVTIDATTQPGFNLYPIIELDGSSVTGHGIRISSAGNTIRGFVINGFSGSGIHIASGNGNVIQGNFIGTDPSGTMARGNGVDGIDVLTSNNLIGGTTAAERNILSGNQDDGINLDIGSGNIVWGNFIGVDVTGTKLLGNDSDGVLIENGSSNNTIGGLAPGEANIIAGNGERGVNVVGNSKGNSIRGNSIHSNALLGIDLAGNGVTANDPNDADGGDNLRQNFPVLTSVVTNGITTTITGTLSSTAGTTFDLDFYANAVGDATGHGEGQTYLGSDTVTTNASGNGSFTVVLSTAVSSGAVISSTATDPSGNTSEFSANVAAGSVPEATDDPQDFSALVNALNPVGYWRLGESAGGTAVDAAGGNDGTYNGASLAQPGALAADDDTAVRFVAAQSDFLEIPHSAAYLLAGGSIQLWFNTSTPAQDGALFSKDHVNLGTGGHLTIWLDSGGVLRVRLQSDTGDNFVTSGSAVSADQWHHVVFTFGAGGMQLYLDGQLVDTNSYTGGLGDTSGGAGNFEPIAIGAGTRVSNVGSVTPLSQYFDGLIDEVAIFDAALTAEQIQNLYASASQAYTLVEGGTLLVSPAGGVLANDFDPAGNALTAILISGPSNAATFTLNADGSFSYTHDGSETTTDFFTYEASNGFATSNIATVTITIVPLNDAPVLDNSGTLTLTDVDEDDFDPAGDTVADVLASAGGDPITDPDPGAVEGIAVVGVDDTNGQWQYNTGSGWNAFGAAADNSAVLLDATALIRFVPNPDYAGPAGNISFRAWDHTDGNASGATGVDVSINGGSTAYSTATGTATLNVLPINDPPHLDLDADNSSGAGGSDFTASFVEGNAPVAVADADATLWDVDHSNLVSLTIAISNLLDGAAESLSADTSGTSIAAAYDSGTGVLSLTGIDSVANYQQVLRTIAYDNSSASPDTTSRLITFVASDGLDESKVAITTVSVTSVNDAPVNTVPGPQSIGAGNALVFSTANGNLISIADMDAGENPVQVSLSASNGVLSLAQSTGLAFTSGDGTADATMTFTGTISDINLALDGLSYQPFSGYGQDSLIITTNDLGHTGGGPLTDVDAVTITVTLVGSPPVAQDDSVQLFAAPALFVPAAGVLANDTDLDGQPLTAVLVSGPSHGAVSLSADGSFTYVPVPGFFGYDSFQYVADDGTLTSAPATVTILVVPGSAPPPDGGSGDSSDGSGDVLSGIDPDEGRQENEDQRQEDEEADEDESVRGPSQADSHLPERIVHRSLDPLLSEEGEAESGLLYQELLAGLQDGAAPLPAGGDATEDPDTSSRDPHSGAVARAPGLIGTLSETLDFNAGLLFNRLDRIEELLEEHEQALEWFIGTAATATTVLTTGYVVWLVRGGYLFAGLLSSMPAWYRLDPLPVLQSGGAGLPSFTRDEDRKESLVEIVKEKSRGRAERTAEARETAVHS